MVSDTATRFLAVDVALSAFTASLAGVSERGEGALVPVQGLPAAQSLHQCTPVS